MSAGDTATDLVVVTWTNSSNIGGRFGSPRCCLMDIAGRQNETFAETPVYVYKHRATLPDGYFLPGQTEIDSESGTKYPDKGSRQHA